MLPSQALKKYYDFDYFGRKKMNKKLLHSKSAISKRFKNQEVCKVKFRFDPKTMPLGQF